MSTGVPDSQVERFALKETVACQQMERSMRLLGEPLESLEQPISPPMATGIVATENAWRDMETDDRQKLACGHVLAVGYSNPMVTNVVEVSRTSRSNLYLQWNPSPQQRNDS